MAFIKGRVFRKGNKDGQGQGDQSLTPGKERREKISQKCPRALDRLRKFSQNP